MEDPRWMDLELEKCTVTFMVSGDGCLHVLIKQEGETLGEGGLSKSQSHAIAITITRPDNDPRL